MGKEQYSEERLNKLSYTKFVRLLGIGRVIFNEMVKVVEKELNNKHLYLCLLHKMENKAL